MKCKNCGAKMFELITTDRCPIKVYICPSVTMVLTEAHYGYMGNIYCDGKRR